MLLVSGSTRTVRGLAGRYPDHLGHLLTPKNRNGMASLLSTGLLWAADNGCFNGLDDRAFRRLLGRVAGQPRLLWVACPDRVGDARVTIELFDQWEPELRAAGIPVAFVGQDGQEDFEVPWGMCECFFVGGSTEWKLSLTAADLMAEAKRRGKWVHVGRVNSLKRMRAMHDRGADSIDGSSASMFGDVYARKYLRWLVGLERQPTLFGG